MFASRLQLLRKQRNLTQKEMANETGININTLAQYEKGNREPNFTTLCALADFFNVSTDYLLGRSNEPFYGASEVFGKSFSNEIVANFMGSMSQHLSAVMNNEVYQDSSEFKTVLSSIEIILRDISNIIAAYEAFEENTKIESLLLSLNSTLANKETVLNKAILESLNKMINESMLPSFSTAASKYIYDIQDVVTKLVFELQASLEKRYKLIKIDTPLISDVKLFGDRKVLVTFDEGTKKMYDIKSHLKNKKYRNPTDNNLSDDTVLDTIRVVNDGHYLCWLDNIKFASNYAIWEDGRIVH